MKLILTSLLVLFISFHSDAQLVYDGLLKKDYIDSSHFKNKGAYVTFAPLSPGNSINTDNKKVFFNASTRLAVHWMTKKYQKFQWFAAYGSGWGQSSHGMTTFETGFMMGKLYKGRKHGIFDLSIGVAYYTRKGTFKHYASPEYAQDWETVRDVHTVGIPFEATANTLKLPVGLGIGIVGNLNINQPYAGLLIRIRLGNPALKKHSTLNWFR